MLDRGSLKRLLAVCWRRKIQVSGSIMLGSVSFLAGCIAVNVSYCQEIGLVALMFFFELLFFYVPPTISLYVSLTNLLSIILFLIC